MATHTATICVIDDHPDNLDLLEQELSDAGYRVLTASDGQRGLEIIAAQCPDLVLLDIMMPGLSGHEVCKTLRRTDETAVLPIILVTAKSGTHDEVLGLDAGANDYVTKPINIETLLARIRTQLRIKQLQDELRRNYESFIRLDKARQDTISMLTHDLKTPLMTVSASSKLLLDHSHQSDARRIDEIASLLLKSSQKMQELVEDFLSLARWERTGLALEIEVCDINAILREAADIFTPLIRDRGLSIQIDVSEEPTHAFADPILIGRVWQNLLSNAIKYNRRGGSINLAITPGPDGHLICRVSDTGLGIPPEVLPKVFEVFYRLENRRDIEGTGLGLAVVKAILDGHRSDHRIRSEVGEGTEVLFNLAAAPSADATPPRAEELIFRPLEGVGERG
jgi:signal transduction histidine kinase